MGMASRESDRYFDADVGKWGAEGAGNLFFGLLGGLLGGPTRGAYSGGRLGGRFWACRWAGQFFLPHVSVLKNAQIFVENSNAGEKYENFEPLTRPPSGA